MQEAMHFSCGVLKTHVLSSQQPRVNLLSISKTKYVRVQLYLQIYKHKFAFYRNSCVWLSYSKVNVFSCDLICIV